MAASAIAASPKVELRDVNLRYFGLEGETEALKGISISVAPGEFVAIIGQSGCGKSTLLSLISGHPHADRRRRAGRRQAGDRAEPQGRLHAAAGLSVRVANHPRKHGAGRRNPGRRHGQGARARKRAADPLRARSVPAPSAAPTLGRHAPARGARAHAVHRAGHRAARRALRRARFADAACAGRRNHRDPAPREARPRSSSRTISAKPSAWRSG